MDSCGALFSASGTAVSVSEAATPKKLATASQDVRSLDFSAFGEVDECSVARDAGEKSDSVLASTIAESIDSGGGGADGAGKDFDPESCLRF